jgi:hypothetical protein
MFKIQYSCVTITADQIKSLGQQVNITTEQKLDEQQAKAIITQLLKRNSINVNSISCYVYKADICAPGIDHIDILCPVTDREQLKSMLGKASYETYDFIKPEAKFMLIGFASVLCLECVLASTPLWSKTGNEWFSSHESNYLLIVAVTLICTILLGLYGLKRINERIMSEASERNIIINKNQPSDCEYDTDYMNQCISKII